MKTPLTEGVTFAQVCHAPLLPGEQYDYSRITPTDEDLRGPDRNSDIYRDKVAAKVGSRPLFTDTEILLDDELYPLHLQETLYEHAETTSRYGDKPRLLSEYMGVYVGVDLETSDGEIGGVVVGTSIPDRDFTDAQIGEFRTLERFKSDPLRMTALILCLADAQAQKIGLSDSANGQEIFDDIAEMTSRLEDALQPHETSTDELVRWLQQYGCDMTITAASNRRQLHGCASKYVETAVARAMPDYGIDYAKLLKSRLSGYRVETFDSLCAGVYTPKGSFQDSDTAGFCDTEAGSIGMNGLLAASALVYPFFHEISHAGGASSFEPATDKDGNFDPVKVGNQLAVWVHDAVVGQRATEGFTELKGAGLYKLAYDEEEDHHSPTYATEQARVVEVEQTHAQEAAFAHSINVMGIATTEDRERLVDFGLLFDDGLRQTSPRQT